MPTNARVSVVDHPVKIQVADGVELWTQFDQSTQIHSVNCDLCGAKITLTKSGHPDGLITHRYSRKCNAISGKQRPQNPNLAAPSSGPSTRRREFSVTVCPGVEIPWQAGSIWTTYAYHLHSGDQLPWHPVSFDTERNTIFLRDVECAKSLQDDTVLPCRKCQRLPHSTEFKNFVNRAQDVNEFTPWKYFSHAQLILHLDALNKKYLALRAELQRSEMRVVRTADRVDEYKRVVMLISTNEIAGLRRLLAASIRRGATAKSLLQLLTRAINGLYSPRGGFSVRELDLGLMVKSIGGPKLLYALSHAYGLPSDRTIRRHHNIPQLLPSVGVPTEDEISHNITAFFSPEVKPFPKAYPNGLPGNLGALDGLALNSKCRYCPQRGVILGVCREHAHRIDTTVSGLESIEIVRDALLGEASKSLDTKVCFGSDATVVAIGSYTRTDYYTMVPVVVSPSDKTEKGPELAKWLQTFIDTWRTHEYGEKVSGPLWALASDGDSTFRNAKHILCHAQPLDPASPLGLRLSPLKGLNLFTSKEGITGTCDPKHIFKRFATLLRNKSGILVFGTNITPQHTIDELSKLPGLSQQGAEELLDPTDKQNVPKAVSLLQRLSALTTLEKPSDAFAANRRDILIFLATFFMCFLQPFIDVNMSLSEQVESLSTFAHLAAVLWIEHGAACITGALYADCQAVIKNIMFVIARCQTIDPDILFHIIEDGSDRLERLFGDTRTQDHARNFDVRQMAEKLSIAALLNAAFERNPDLDRGHRRLSLDGAIGIDHVNPRSWKGDVRVGNVDLEATWSAGLKRANAILEQFFGPEKVQDFSKILKTPAHDFLRPDGKTYVGSKASESDRSIEVDEIRTKNTETIAEQPSEPQTEREDTPLAASERDHNDDNEPQSDGEGTERPERSTSNEFDTDAESSDSESDGVDDAILHASDSDFEDIPEEFTFDDYLDLESEDDTQEPVPDEPSVSHGATAETGITLGASKKSTSKPLLQHTFLVDGKPVRIDPLVSQLSPKYWKRVTMRTLRVQGRVIEDFSKSALRGSGFFDTENIEDKELMKATDLAGILVKSGDKICLAVMEVTSFSFPSGGEKVLRTAAKYIDLAKESSRIRVIGQIIHLVPSQHLDDEGHPVHWEWHRKYICLDTTAKSTQFTRSQYVIEVPSAYVHPLNPNIARSSTSSQSPDKLVWSIPRAALDDTLDHAWSELKPLEGEILSNLQRLPSIGNADILPYPDVSGRRCFYVENVPPQLIPAEKFHGSTRVHCFLCSEEMPVNLMRNHVGAHILWDTRIQKLPQDPNGPDTKTNPVGAFPCGFCGLDGCYTQLTERRKGSKMSYEVRSTCLYHYERWSYASAAKGSNTQPCTNVPIPCTLCPRTLSGDPHTIWKYSAYVHLVLEHPSVLANSRKGDHNKNDTSGEPKLPPDMIINMHIPEEEELALGVQKELTEEFREDNDVLASDDIRDMQEELERDTAYIVTKRGRTATVSVVEPKLKKRK